MPDGILSTAIAAVLQPRCKAVDHSRSTRSLKYGRWKVALDQDKLNDFLGRFVGDLGATVAAASVVMGDQLGLYQALAGHPARPSELAERTRLDTRYVTEWLRGQAAGGYISYDPATEEYSLTEEQAFALANPA